jgi:hypothetical protein
VLVAEVEITVLVETAEVGLVDSAAEHLVQQILVEVVEEHQRLAQPLVLVVLE